MGETGTSVGTSAGDPLSTSSGDPSGGTSSSTGAGEASSSSTGEDEDPKPLDPADLPFGGYVQWGVQGPGVNGRAAFYELPDDPSYEPDHDERPLEPREEDRWVFIALDNPPKPQLPRGNTPLEVASEFEVTSAAHTLVFTYSDDLGRWDMPWQALEPPYGGEPWTLDIPMQGVFPAANYPDVVEGLSPDTVGLTLGTNELGVPTALQWAPHEGAYQATALFVALGLEGEFLALCGAALVDDGNAEIPDECVGLGETPVDPDVYAFMAVVLNIDYKEDIVYAEHRVRVTSSSGTQMNLPYPFSAAMVPGPSGSLVELATQAPAFSWDGEVLLASPNR